MAQMGDFLPVRCRPSYWEAIHPTRTGAGR